VTDSHCAGRATAGSRKADPCCRRRPGPFWRSLPRAAALIRPGVTPRVDDHNDGVSAEGRLQRARAHRRPHGLGDQKGGRRSPIGPSTEQLSTCTTGFEVRRTASASRHRGPLMGQSCTPGCGSLLVLDRCPGATGGGQRGVASCPACVLAQGRTCRVGATFRAARCSPALRCEDLLKVSRPLSFQTDRPLPRTSTCAEQYVVAQSALCSRSRT
jgi:hypothetical protein